MLRVVGVRLRAEIASHAASVVDRDGNAILTAKRAEIFDLKVAIAKGAIPSRHVFAGSGVVADDIAETVHSDSTTEVAVDVWIE